MSAFIESIVLARQEAADDAGALAECATQLQQHNRDLKQYIAKLDAEAVKEATAGWGTNDRKLIVSLCSRTKSQLRRCALDQSVAPTHNPEHLHYYGRRGTWLRVRATAPSSLPLCNRPSLHRSLTPSLGRAQDGGQVPRAVRRGPARGGADRDERQLRQARGPRARAQGCLLRGHHRQGVP